MTTLTSTYFFFSVETCKLVFTLENICIFHVVLVGRFHSITRSNPITVEALVSGHPRDAKKVSVTGAGRLREWFS